MKKRTTFTILATLTIAAGIFAGCGSHGNPANTVPSNATTSETGSALNHDKPSKETSAEQKQADSNQNPEETPQEKITDEKEDAAKETAAPEAFTEQADTQTKAGNNSNAGNNKAKAGDNNNAGNNKAKAGNNSGSKPSDENSGSETTDGSAPQPSQPEAPAHEHVWQEHTATRQEWIPNIVVVDDYETQYVEVGCNIECNCGAILANAAELEEHGMNHILAGEDTSHWTVPIYEEQQVKVGSHEEDHGHYEDVSYVDYYYCDCGATR